MRSWWRNGVAAGMAVGLVAGVAACDPGPEEVGQDLLEELAQGASEDEVYDHLGPGPYEGVDEDEILVKVDVASDADTGTYDLTVTFVEEQTEEEEEVDLFIRVIDTGQDDPGDL